MTKVLSEILICLGTATCTDYRIFLGLMNLIIFGEHYWLWNSL